jgi:hypothetical protein
MENKVIKIIDQDIIFLSYDEPNAEKNYADLLTKVPWAKRVHGVKGSDAAHKACAKLCETEYFITVDGDNIIDPQFLEISVDLDELGLDNSYVFSWCGKVHVNGLQYGNGGLKMWTPEFVNNMRTHENSNPDDVKGLVEFCFDNKYYQFNENYSTSYTNASPFQAWRAGFREGVKMSLDQGAKTKNLKTIWWQNYDRLLIWCNIGADVENGLWSIYGAREGAYLTNCTDWDYTLVRDFEYLTEKWKEKYSRITDKMLPYEISGLGETLKHECGLELFNPCSDSSKFLKQVYNNSPRIVRKKYNV